jgi:hypothetical protein
MKRTRALLASLSLACALPLALRSRADEPRPGAVAEPTPASVPAQGTTADDAAPKTKAPVDHSVELDQLEQELASVMDELVQARARAGVIARGLFQTELSVDVVRRADEQRLAHLTLTLDGVPVHDSDGAALARDSATLFSGYVAPGFHELGIELVENAKTSATFGYTRNERYRIELKKGQSTRVELVLHDDSDMAEEAAEGDHGEYQLETTVRVSGKAHSGKARD